MRSRLRSPEGRRQLVDFDSLRPVKAGPDRRSTVFMTAALLMRGMGLGGSAVRYAARRLVRPQQRTSAFLPRCSENLFAFGAGKAC